MEDLSADPAASFAAEPWLKMPPVVLGEAATVPGMIGPAERQLCTWLALRWARGAGDCVDLGAFLGAATACFAQGLRLGGHAGLVHAHDRFTASPAVQRKWLPAEQRSAGKDRSVLEQARGLLAPWQDRVRLHPGDLLTQRSHGGPIEILMVDLAGSVALADHVAEAFYPALIPGRSVVVLRDFFFEPKPWLAMQADLLAAQLQPLAYVGPTTLVCQCRAAIAPGDARLAGRSDDALLKLLDGSAARLAPMGLQPRVMRMRDRLAARPGARSAADLRD